MTKICRACGGPVCTVCGGCIAEGECECIADSAVQAAEIGRLLAEVERLQERDAKTQQLLLEADYRENWWHAKFDQEFDEVERMKGEFVDVCKQLHQLQAEIEQLRPKAEWYDVVHRPIQPWEIELESLYRDDSA